MSQTQDAFKNAQELVAPQLNEVNRCIREWLNSDIALINTLSAYIIESGGKRLRPLLLLLVAKALGYKGQHDVTLAAVIEFIHTATLLHDDVVDESNQRRGKETANEVWGNAASVLVGDFLYSRAFEMMVTTDNMQVMHTLSHTTNKIAEGEVQQLLNAHNAHISEADYFSTIDKKTAILFAAAARLGVIINEDYRQEQLDQLEQFGRHLGVAFQLVDDVLDYSSDSETLGKNIGDDIAEGKPTLPLIYALKHVQDTAKRNLLIQAVNQGEREQLENIVAIIQETGGIEYTRQKAYESYQAAIDCLDILGDSESKKALETLAKFSIERLH